MAHVEALIENPAGSPVKHHYDEETFALLRVEQVNAPYPYPYGFVPGTRAADGDALDVFVITKRPLASGDLVDCEPVGLLEQTEGGLEDDDLIAVLPGEPVPDLEPVVAAITEFLQRVFAGMPGRETWVGRLLSAEDALAHLAACREAAGAPG